LIATGKVRRLKKNLGGADIALSQARLIQIEQAAATIHVERYPEHLMATVGR